MRGSTRPSPGVSSEDVLCMCVSKRVFTLSPPVVCFLLRWHCVVITSPFFLSRTRSTLWWFRDAFRACGQTFLGGVVEVSTGCRGEPEESPPRLGALRGLSEPTWGS